VSPFNFIIPRLNKINGKDSKNLPAKASKIASSNDPKKINTLNALDIFFVGALAISLNNK